MSQTQAQIFPKTFLQPRALELMFHSILVLNLFDAVLTLCWVQCGVAEEANLLLADLLARSVVLFMLAKLSLVSLGVLLLWRHRARPLATYGAVAGFAAYSAILVQHLRVAAYAFV